MTTKMNDFTEREIALIHDVFLDKVLEVEEVIRHEETDGKFDVLMAMCDSVLTKSSRRILDAKR